MYNTSDDSINGRFWHCGFLGIYLYTLQQMSSIINKVYSGSMICVKSYAHEDDQDPMQCGELEQKL